VSAEVPVAWTAATRPKVGNRESENEDAIAVAPAVLRFAVADGATEGWHSREWADHLAKSYVRRPPEPARFPAWLANVRREWSPPARVEAADAWYAEAKEAEGAFAALVGVQLVRRPAGGNWTWKAVAIGDSCLFVIRDRQLLQAFPVESSSGFGSRPALVPSSPQVGSEANWLAGQAEVGDVIALATDRVAEWLLSQAEAGAEVWPRVAGCLEPARPSARREVVTQLLDLAQAGRNDDSSLLVFIVPEIAR
jgi:hypothetical protein